jgi:hypothetical protein
MRLSFTAFSLGLSSAALGACADNPTGGDDDVVTATALDRCAEPGVALTQAWNVDNLHGRIVALTIAADGTAVVATEDGAVKQWSLGVDAGAAPLPGGRPSYGVPFDDGGAPVRAVAVAGDRVLGAGNDGTLRQWALSDASALPAQTMKIPLTAVAGLDDGVGVIADENFGGGIRTVSLSDGETSAPFETSLWGVTTMLRTDDALFVAGHDYGIAAVERRDPSAPETVTGVWDPEGAGGGGEFLQGWVTSIAVSTDGSTLVAGSDGANGGLGFVFTIDPDNLLPGPTFVVEQAGVRAVAVTATGGHVAIATDGHVALHPADLSAAIGGVDVEDPVALAIDPSGERLIVASGDGHLRAFTCEE